MPIIDTIAADQEAIKAAQEALDTAKAKLATDEAALEAARPHLTALEKIESFASSIPEQARELFAAAIAEARSLF